MIVTCNQCGKDAPAVKDPNKLWTTYKTKEPCECGGKFIPDFSVTKED